MRDPKQHQYKEVFRENKSKIDSSITSQQLAQEIADAGNFKERFECISVQIFPYSSKY